MREETLLDRYYSRSRKWTWKDEFHYQWEGALGSFIRFVFVLGIALFGMYSCANSEWYKKDQEIRRQKEAAQQLAERTPRLVSTSGDCEVYAFKPTPSSQWMYFTRCASGSVSTTNNWTTTTGGKNPKTTHHQTTINTEPK